MPATDPDSRPEANPQRRHTHSVLLQMLAVFLVISTVVVWQWEVVRQIYLQNQINAIGWAINGGILLLFFCGLGALAVRFFEYRGQESAIIRLLQNLGENRDPMEEVDEHSMLAGRYRTLRELHQRRADVNQSALAATLLATESSRNSFLKFVHNVLILTGVFGTIVSLSLSLLGASDMIHGPGSDLAGASAAGRASGLGTMIFGMSTALSTTMTAILAYLFFGYFYIKLTDTQTYLISRVEEVTATVLVPHLQLNQHTEKDYSDSVRNAGQLIERFDQSQQQYEGAVQALLAAAQSLSRRLDEEPGGGLGRADLEAMLTRMDAQQQRAAEENRALLAEAVNLLREGFRLGR